MKSSLRVVSCGILCCFLLVLAITLRVRAADAGKSPVPDYVLAGPYTHDNLTLYIIRGGDSLNGKHYLTLEDALARKVVVVHETGDVNQLAIENVSKDKYVYIQSGDIVKGGRQDRTIARDFICGPGSGQMPIDAFCVEHGRWTQRGGESSSLFSSSNDAIAGKDLKLAAKGARSQSAVWNEVAANQTKLSANAGHDVTANASGTSFQLTVEDKAVQDRSEEYVKALQNAIDTHSNAIGFAFAINGQVNSAEVYGSHELFVQLWPKLLKSSAIEAFAEAKKDAKFEPVKPSDILAALNDAASGKASQEKITPTVNLVIHETDKDVVYETHDLGAEGSIVHRSYLTKDGSPTTRPAEENQSTQLRVNSPNQRSLNNNE
jgi:hypothetical protein